MQAAYEVPMIEVSDARRVVETAFTRGWLDDDQREQARQLLQRLSKALTAPSGEAQLHIAEDGSGFCLAEGSWVDLSRRKPLKRILEALVSARLRGRPVKKPELIEAGWPGERLLPHAASNRLHVALSELRKMGLADAISYRSAGWTLSAAIAVEITEPAH